MADSKITGLTSFDSSNTPYWPPAPASDVIPIVDVSDNTMAASGTTKKISINNLLSSSPTAGGNFSITGDLTVDTSTLKVDSANDRVGIGTATPGGALEVFKNTNGQNRLFLNNPSTGTGAYDAIDFTAGTASNQILSMSSGYSGSFPYLTGALLLRSAQANGIVLNTAGSAAAIQFGINDTLGMTLNSTGLNIANGNVILGTSGKGIDFSATASGSGTMTSELLNDYEEGEWTGTLKGSTSDPTTPVTATGKYTKIGRQVTVQISFISVNTTGASSRILVSGLPFAASSSPNGVTGSVLTDLAATFTGSPAIYLGPSATQLDLYSSVSNGAVASVTHNAGTARSLWLNVTYTV